MLRNQLDKQQETTVSPLTMAFVGWEERLTDYELKSFGVKLKILCSKGGVREQGNAFCFCFGWLGCNGVKIFWFETKG